MNTHKKIIVSACLAGCCCKYSGGDNLCEAVVELVRQGRAIPVCPEQLGGLPTPRPCCEIRKNGEAVEVWNDRDENVTEYFARGAQEAFRIASLAGCTAAVLKERSPSCGAGVIYDGTFQHIHVPGDGLFAALCRENGLAIFTESDLEENGEPCSK
ncbi:DUF523 domain-containing protein [Desulfobaculum bizertense]|uniref:Uncharacterized conserved protein YbbK, DUF523 family n=1 Tax=Desulfobaculum bizertense DSM 18034 TaxID=1121442 RepID=A0A1T4WGM6_9BACT|nr:DUF523 domain-containing protein [Desulfobaculum bizertense]UIJ39400.1 DUF523 domain-containing protein [Desulfobaculum bizertense]SKA76473.1 Uncharacterized conserved protein YbbK, DUF523 family [Desulfobaculum bizertense DSM 18034]